MRSPVQNVTNFKIERFSSSLRFSVLQHYFKDREDIQVANFDDRTFTYKVCPNKN